MTAMPVIVADTTYPGMYRLRFADGTLSDLANITRIKDAKRLFEAEGLAQPCNGPPMRNSAVGQGEIPATQINASAGSPESNIHDVLVCPTIPPCDTAGTLRGQITGQSKSHCEEVTAESPLGLCRALLKAGYDPATRLELYRGTTLALIISSIGAASRTVVASAGFAQRAA